MSAVVSQVPKRGTWGTRSSSGPDPETARAIAQAEMHEESCRLQGYKESLKTRDKQNEREHEYR
ncbi:MAG TPA: hypothetical protein VHD85_04850, partial [Terracidiphilus sp.]|nr:hypothetical protein [Terracidiphilus sp.]